MSQEQINDIDEANKLIDELKFMAIRLAKKDDDFSKKLTKMLVDSGLQLKALKKVIKEQELELGYLLSIYKTTLRFLSGVEKPLFDYADFLKKQKQ